MGLAFARVLAALAAGAAAAFTLVGCGSSAATTAAASSPIPVVASTNVWGNVATVVGGSRVNVTSVISDPAADPHSYEASARTQLAVSRARVVIENGGGYDDFMARLLNAAGAKPSVIDAVDISGKAAAAKAGAADLNEHVWYDFPTVGKVADSIESALSRADPKDAASFRANAAAFHVKLDALIARERADKTRTAGSGVAITEPVPLYLLQALGAVNKTPPAFSHAVEAGDDVSPSVLRQTTALFTSGAVKALVYNAQTADSQTAAVRKAAESAHVAVVPVTETLPAGRTYLSWMSDNLDAISKALGS
jgi:zinc/manganese transport system substrate-binding protein